MFILSRHCISKSNDIIFFTSKSFAINEYFPSLQPISTNEFGRSFNKYFLKYFLSQAH